MPAFKWTVEFEVSETWVADGFELDDDRASEMIASALPYAYGGEISAKVVKRPSAARVARAQGYKSVADYRNNGPDQGTSACGKLCVLFTLLGALLVAPSFASDKPATPRVKPTQTITVKVMPADRFKAGETIKITAADADSCVAWVASMGDVENAAYRACKDRIAEEGGAK